MDPLYRIQGGGPLHGDVLISGAKNAALPILVATLLAAAHAQTEDTIMFAPKQSTPAAETSTRRAWS